MAESASIDEAAGMAEAEKPTPNRKLRYERERRGWSQQDVADKVGTTPLNVGRWERGVTVPGPHFRLKLSEVFEKSPFDLGFVVDHPGASFPTEPSPVTTIIPPDMESSVSLWNVPYRRNSFFTGREEVLEQLHSTLTEQVQPVAISQPQAISGLGGIGKTQTAIEYAYRYRDDYTAVFWVRAESAELLVSDYLTISALLDIPERNEQEQRKIVNAVLRWFDTHKGWLLILDNADDLDVTSAFIPTSGKGHVLITTRSHSTGTIAGRIELDTMTIEEGMFFLLYRIKRIRGNASLESVPESIRNQARAIVEAMDALPLALDQAGAYIEETGTSLSDYLKLYQARRHRLLRMRGQDATGHPEPVATTWSLSMEKIRQTNPAAAELLCLLALLHPDNIPESMIAAGASELGSVLQPMVSNEFDFNEALGELHKFSLIKRDPEEKLIVIHRLVQAVIWDRMHEKEREQWMARAVDALDAVFPDVTHAVWEECERLLPHVLNCASIGASENQNLEFASVLYKAAAYLCERARYIQAEPLYLRALRMREQALGTEHCQVAYTLHGLADLYREQGKFEEAKPLYRRGLRILEQATDAEHPQIARLLNNLAHLYVELGAYKEAEPLYLRALQIWERMGTEHLDIAYPLNGIAILYAEQGKYEQAEPFYRQALQILEQALGLEHPRIAYPLNGLAILYAEQGKYEQAELLFYQVLHIWEQALGSEHPRVAWSLNNLAIIYQDQGRYEQAEQFYRRSLHIWEQALGMQHPDVALSLSNLAELYYLQGEYEQAGPLFQKALLIREQILGQQHPHLATSLRGLANLYREKKEYEGAEPLYQRALAILQRQRGEQHPETATCLHDFGRFYEVRQQPEEAIALYQQALAIREQRLGPQHPHTIDTRTRTARLLREMGRTEEADALEAISMQQIMTNEQPE